MSAEYEVRGESEQGDEIDWEGERRWTDSLWVRVALLALFLGGSTVLLILFLTGRGVLAVTVGVGTVAVGIGAGVFMQRRMAREVGVTSDQLFVLARRIQKERIPHDPANRRVMATLVRQQRRAARHYLRYWPYMIGVYVLFIPLQLVSNRYWSAVFFGALSVSAIVSRPIQRKAIARFDRVAARLGADGEPKADAS